MFKFYLKLSGLISSLEAAGYIITDDDLAMHLVTGLNGDYEVAAIYITGNLANMTWNEVSSILLLHESRNEPRHA